MSESSAYDLSEAMERLGEQTDKLIEMLVRFGLICQSKFSEDDMSDYECVPLRKPRPSTNPYLVQKSPQRVRRFDIQRPRVLRRIHYV